MVARMPIAAPWRSRGDPHPRRRVRDDCGGRCTRLIAGQTLYVPAEAIHAGGNIGATPGRRVVIFSRAGMENFFLEIGAPSADIEIEPGAALATAIRHGWRFITQEHEAAP
jgi:hypothetical protein